jgi:nucleoside-diphosphate-sugar epimerase
MRVLVTGADGYIGVPLVAALAARGHEVVGLDTGFYRDGWLYGPPSERECIRKDIRHVTGADLEGFRAVVHLAELSNDPLAQLDPEITHEINHRASVRLAGLCKRQGIPRFVYSSSCSVYGIGSGEFKTEESPTAPQTAYARCKVLVERDVGALADDHFSPTFLRNATAYGPSPRMRFDLVLNNLAGWAWTTGEIKLTSDGTPYRPLVHVADIAAAVACTLEAPRERIHRQIFNVGHTRQNYQVREIAAIVAKAFPGSRLVLGSNDADRRSYRVAFEKIHAELPGFQAVHDAEAGAAELRALFERVELSTSMFEHRAFTRVRQLTHLLRTESIDERLFWRDRVPAATRRAPPGNA